MTELSSAFLNSDNQVANNGHARAVAELRTTSSKPIGIE